MKDRFDEKLASKIRSELANYQPAYNDTHWEAFQKKMPTSGAVIPYFKVAAAAVLLLLCFLPHFHLNEQYNRSWAEIADADALLADTLASTSEVAAKQPPIEVPQQAAVLKQPLVTSPKRSAADAQRTAVSPSLPTAEVRPNQAKEVPNPLQNVRVADAAIPSQMERAANAGRSIVESRQKRQSVTVDPVGVATGNSDTDLLQLQKMPAQLLAMRWGVAEVPNLPLPKKTTEDSPNPSKWSWEAQASIIRHDNPDLNFNAYGFSGGVRIGRQIGERWELLSGLNLAHQTAKVLPNQQNFSADDEMLSGANMPIFGFASLSSRAATERVKVVTKQGTLTSLEIPLAMRYHFRDDARAKFYMLGGFNALLHLKERYRFEEQYLEVFGPGDYPNVEVREREITVGAFQHADFLPYMQLAFGWQPGTAQGTPIGAEVFVNLPIGQMGTHKVNNRALGFRLVYRLK